MIKDFLAFRPFFNRKRLKAVWYLFVAYEAALWVIQIQGYQQAYRYAGWDMISYGVVIGVALAVAWSLIKLALIRIVLDIANALVVERRLDDQLVGRNGEEFDEVLR